MTQLSKDNRPRQGRPNVKRDMEGVGKRLPSFLTQSEAELHSKFTELLEAEFDRMRSAEESEDPHHPFALMESSPVIEARNRYQDVVPFANSRIKLKVPEGECDYINASPIKLKEEGSKKTYRYIATQGPTADYVDQFWNMVFNETGSVGVIVMLTSLYEKGREKCSQYFPLDSNNRTIEFTPTSDDPFVDEKTAAMARARRDRTTSTSQPPNPRGGKVTLLETEMDETARTVVRKLRLTVGNSNKIVYHYHFMHWPDHGRPSPSDRDAMVALTRITAEKAGDPSNPRIVHCSAGVGRTGTFIALDHLLRELQAGRLLAPQKVKLGSKSQNSLVEEGEKDAIYDTVNELRLQRMYMVFTRVQYLFIHDVLKQEATLMLEAGKGDKRDSKAAAILNGSQMQDYSGKKGQSIDEKTAEEENPYARTWEEAKPRDARQPKVVCYPNGTVLTTVDSEGRTTERATGRISAEEAAPLGASLAFVPSPKSSPGSSVKSARSISGSPPDHHPDESLRARRLRKMPKLANVMPPRLSMSSDSGRLSISSSASLASSTRHADDSEDRHSDSDGKSSKTGTSKNEKGAQKPI
ncbi:hypothetical protein KEM55_002234 [Ascosphaera atra]|nr:hypothetical protein KEM55_002234 [Ascosphaera atra]